jgi:hypothetical protein
MDQSGSVPKGQAMHSKYCPDPDVLVQRMGQEMILLHLRTNRFYELNRTGARLWELVCAGLDRSGVQEQMSCEFDVDAAQLGTEIDGLLATLAAEQLLNRHDDS